MTAGIKLGKMSISLTGKHSFRLKNKGLDTKEDMLIVNSLIRDMAFHPVTRYCTEPFWYMI